MKARILLVLSILLLIVVIVFIIDYVALNRSLKKEIDMYFEPALNEAHAGNYTRALSDCDMVVTSRAICRRIIYVTIVNTKHERNETITKEFCDTIPVDEWHGFGRWWEKLPYFNSHLNKTITTYQQRGKELNQTCYTWASKQKLVTLHLPVGNFQ